jgi:ureidoglycolate dehydrogenase (NAD+)
MAGTRHLVDHKALRSFVSAIFAAKGMRPDQAAMVAEVLVWANLRGTDSHGVSRIPRYLAAMQRGHFNPQAEPEITPLSEAAFRMDCRFAAGAVAVRRALDEAIRRARTSGIACGLFTESTHTGAIGHYAERGAEQGVIAIVIVTGAPNMAYHGAAAPSLATAPIAIGVPSADGRILLLDMATGIVPIGRVRQALAEGKAIPLGWALDGDGKPTTDPAKAEITLPLGGAKGSGLSLMFECLTGILGAKPILASSGTRRRGQNGLVIAIDVARFRPLADFIGDVGTLARAIKALPRLPEVEEILLPGERGARQAEERSRKGIPIAPKSWAALEEIARELGLAMPALQTLAQ